MQAHERHREPPPKNGSSYLSRHRWLTYISLGILAYFLFIEHREHVVPYLPLLIIPACILMHFLMHRGHSHQGPSENQKEMGK